jgi:outer membrane translocation and assembly module TamA
LFFRNFQLVGFFDVGTAWEGSNPYSEENPLNTSVVENSGLVSVKVNYFRDPIVAGYGGGVRAMLFGYFVRLDYAWGIETRTIQDPMLYLSIGTDF